VTTRKVPKTAHILAILKILLAKLLILAEKKAKLPKLLFSDLGAEKSSRLIKNPFLQQKNMILNILIDRYHVQTHTKYISILTI
jgi:hypothetical protein